MRGGALSERPLTIASVSRAFIADTWWGAAAGLWITTGLWRLLEGTEKETSYYFHNRFFMAKMAILVVILVLEIRPMIVMTRWRRALKKSAETWSPDGSLVRVEVKTISPDPQLHFDHTVPPVGPKRSVFTSAG